MQIDTNQPSLPIVFRAFLKLGLTAFGGPAMVPYIRRTVVCEKEWLDEETFRLGVGAAQLVPGATAMQVAAWAGLRIRGTLGALAAYLAFGLPAFLLMLGLSVLYSMGSEVPRIQAAFSGLQLVVAALVLSAAFDFSEQYCDDLKARLLALAAGCWLALKGNPIVALVAICLLCVPLYRNVGALTPLARRSGKRRFLVPLVLVCIALIAWGGLFLYDPALADMARLMARIDVFAFGGGYVSLPLMLHEVVEVRGWLSEGQFMDGIALGQLTPGPIVMTATFVGYRVADFSGAAVATIAVFTPSFLILRFVPAFLERLLSSPVAARMLKGSLISLVGLMAAVAGRFLVAAPWSPAAVIIAGCAFIALRMRVDVLYVVLAGAFFSCFIL